MSLPAFDGLLKFFSGQGQCLAMGMWFNEREKNLFAGHLFRDFFILTGVSKTLRLPNCDQQALLDHVQVRLVERFVRWNLPVI